MTKRILVISGRKQSGKDTLGNFLIANHKELFGPESIVRKMGFADPLKQTVHELFNVPLEWLYGTEEDKNRLTGVRWKDLPHWVGIVQQKHNTMPDEPGLFTWIMNWGKEQGGLFLTARELLQQFGTNIVRRMNPDAWTNALKKRIDRTEANLIVIVDCRFPDEVLAAKSWGGKVIRLRRNEDVPAEHESECALDKELFDWVHFDAVIDNREMSKERQNGALLRVLNEWGWITYRTSFDESIFSHIELMKELGSK